MLTPKGSIYIHIPFCRGKCRYCDFYSVGLPRGGASDFMRACREEMRLRAAEMPSEPPSIYIGGGTPSLLLPPDVEALGAAMRAAGVRVESAGEFTVEMNPDDVDLARAEAWRSIGANRASMGVQSFADAELSAVGRRHTGRRADEAYSLLRKHFDNISIDLIYGLPGQTEASWHESVRHALNLRPEHISAYSLMYEPGTPLTRLRDAGRIKETPDDVVLRMMDFLADATAAAGYERYEISNFALPGRESRHNSAYWRSLPYIGLGPGAHSFDGVRTRSANPPDLRGYLANYLSDAPQAFAVRETLTDTELLEELIFTRLRTREGIDCAEVECRFGVAAREALMQKCAPHFDRGTLHLCAEHIALTRKGIAIANAIELDLMPD